MTAVNKKIRIAKTDAATWAAWGGVLANGQPAFEEDTNKVKIGNNADNWAALPYVPWSEITAVDISNWNTVYGNNHVAVTLGTANGLSLATQQLSLQAADATHPGALIAADWNTFNAKEPAIAAGLNTQYWRGDKSWQVLSTTIVPEGTNLYYTAARFNAAFAGKTTADLTEGSNLYYTAARFNTAFAAKTTTDLAEGGNLYYTQTRFDNAFAVKTTTDLTEGANKYYTDERVDDRVAVLIQNGTGISWTYVDGAGTLTGNVSLATFSTTDLAEGGNLYFTTARVLGTALTGLNITGGAVTAADTILQAFGKVQNQINGVLGGAIYQGVWNANTNSPALASGVGTKGYYYVVSVAGATNLDGTADWKVGDWAIFNGATWDKVDNTDAVSSVNGHVGAVSLVTSDIAESGNLYYTQARFDTAFGAKSTTNLAEGTNLYYTNARVDTRVAAYTGDVTLTGTTFAIGNTKVTNAMLAGGIAYSKLTLTGAILNADLAGAITDAKLNSSYVYADGTRALTADWGVGTFSITGIKSYAISGTAGNGYGEFIAQSGNASAPAAAGFRMFAGSTGSLNWVRKNGADTYVRTFDAALTADRTYTLPDVAGTVTLIAATQTLTNKTLGSGTVVTLGSDATGDIYYNGGSGVFTRLGAGAAGTFFRWNGAGAAPTVSTNTLPNTTAANNIWYATGTNALGSNSNFGYNGTTFYVGNTGPTKAAQAEVNGQLNLNAALGGTFISMSASATSNYKALLNLAATTADLVWFRATGANGSESFSETVRVLNTNGDVGIGTGATVSARVHVVKTTEQVRVGYDASNYYSTTVSSTGGVTFDAVGSGAAFTFSDGIVMAVAKALSVSSGSNQRAGNATLVGGTITVNNTTVTANTVLMLTRKTSGGTIGTAITYTLSAGNSFTINSDNILDTSTFSYFMIEVP
jgi:hypothetical protein